MNQDQIYLCNRVRTSLDLAGSAADSASRLVHFELAGRYSMMAAKSAGTSTALPALRCEHSASSFHRAGAPAIAA